MTAVSRDVRQTTRVLIASEVRLIHGFRLALHAVHTANVTLRTGRRALVSILCAASLATAFGAWPWRGPDTPEEKALSDWLKGAQLMALAMVDPTDQSAVEAALAYTGGDWAIEAQRELARLEGFQPRQLPALDDRSTYMVLREPEIDRSQRGATLLVCEHLRGPTMHVIISMNGKTEESTETNESSYRSAVTLRHEDGIWKTVEAEFVRSPDGSSDCGFDFDDERLRSSPPA
jgi:hypothetical protein